MRPTRLGQVSPRRSGLIFKGVGVDPDTETEDPEPPTDRAADGDAEIPFLPPPDPGPVQDLNLLYGTDYDGGGNRPVVDPTNANDGNSSTLAGRTSYYNASGTDTWWLEADLGAAYDVENIVIRGGFGNSGENDPPWEIQHSPDSSAWTTAVGTYVWNGATTPRTATLTLTSTQTKRYWRVGQTITYVGLIYPVKVHSFQINGESVGDPSNPIWIDAPLTIDGDGTTYDLASEDTLTSTAGAFWRGDLGDSYAIASMEADVGFEDAGSVTVLVQAGDESDYSDQATVGTVILTATGSYTSDDVDVASLSDTGVHRYWQLVLDTAAQGVYVYEVGLFDPPEFTGAHEDLTGRDTADQHPADAVTFTPYSTIAATDVQAAIEELLDETTGAALNNFSATSNPATTDDTGDGYSIGSRWINTSTDVGFVATDVTASAALWRHAVSVGLVDEVAPRTADYVTAPTTSEAMPANGGTVVVPMIVAGPMRFRNVYIHSRDTATARSAEFRLYQYNPATSALEFVTGTDGTYSFTPSAASDRSANVSGTPVLLAPGAYWLALRNTSATQTFGLGYSALAATYWNQSTTYYSQTLGSALGSTLTQSGWTTGARAHAIRMRSTTFGT